MRKEDKQELFNAFGIVGSIGLTMAATLAVGLYLGRMADDRLGVAPWATITGILLGVLAGFWATYKKVIGR